MASFGCHNCSPCPARGADWEDVIEDGKEAHRSDEWYRSQVMKFVQQYCPHETDPSEDDIDEAVEVMKNSEPKKFADTLMRMTIAEAKETVEELAKSVDPEEESHDLQHFVISAFHTRRDIYSDVVSNKKVVASFTGNNLIRKYPAPKTIADEFKVPRHVAIRSIQHLIEVLGTVTRNPLSGGDFNIDPNRNGAYIMKLYKRINKEIDWDTCFTAFFCVPPWEEGVVFSPAFNSLWTVRDKPKGNLLLWVLVSANAAGKQSTKYVGMDFDEWYESWPDTQITPLSHKKNIYLYQLKRNPLILTVKVYFAAQPPWKQGEAYVTVTTVFQPALKEIVDDYYDCDFPKLEKMKKTIIKGCLMFDLMQQYYPGETDVELFRRVNNEPGMNAAGAGAIGGVLDLVSDFANWRDALWIIPPSTVEMQEKRSGTRNQAVRRLCMDAGASEVTSMPGKKGKMDTDNDR